MNKQINITKRQYLLAAAVFVTIVAAFCFPKPKYHSPDILSKLSIPMNIYYWRATDISDTLNAADARYNFISKIFARIYKNKYGGQLLFLILDAGNFHNPKVCFGSSGYTFKDLPDTVFTLDGREFKAKTILFKKENENYLLLYWLSIDKRIVDWTQQKFIQFLYSLFNKEKVGLMVRIEIQLPAEDTDKAVKFAREFVSDTARSIPKDDREYIFGT